MNEPSTETRRLKKELHLAFTIGGLPKSVLNGSHGNHFAKAAERQKWKRWAMHAIAIDPLRNKECEPLGKAYVVLTRASSREPDFDNLVATFKPILDSLVVMGVIVDDKSSVIGQPEYRWEKAKPKQGSIRVEVWK